MKLESGFFDGEARIMRQGETILDVIQDIASAPCQDDSFAVLDIGDVVQKIKTWKLLLPRVKPFYAVKCNDHPTILQILAALGTGFDCASKVEMKKVVSLGVEPARIIFAHPCKPVSHLRQAKALKVDLMTFDNESELLKVKDLMPEARLVLRLRCDALSAQCPLGMKFGVDPGATRPLLALAKSLGLNVVGVSFHVGSGCQEPQVFLRAIAAAREVFDEAFDLGFSPDLLDIGGGFPGGRGSDLGEIASYINDALDQYFPDDVQVIAEPGRYVVASAVTVVTHVVSKREVAPGGGQEGGKSSFMYYINDGVYGSFNCVLYDHQSVTPEPLHELLSEGDPSQPLYPSSIWGPTCDSLDLVVPDAQLPELTLGDWIVWRDMGAYTLAASGGVFNGFPIPRVHVVVPFHSWLFLEGVLATSYSPLEIGGLGWGGSRPHGPTFTAKFAEDNSPTSLDIDVTGLVTSRE